MSHEKMVNLMPKRCCCWFDQKTGAMALGWISLFEAVVRITYVVLRLDYVASYHYVVKEGDGPKYIVPVDSRPMLIITGTVSSIFLAASVLLILGALRENHYFVLPWLLHRLLESIAGTVCVLIVFIVTFIVPKERVWSTVGYLVLTVLLAALYWYLWLCVLAFFNSLKTNTTEPNNPLAARAHERGPPPYQFAPNPYDFSRPVNVKLTV